MKTLKTYDIWKMIDEDYKGMEGKRFKLIKKSENLRTSRDAIIDVNEIVDVSKCGLGQGLFYKKWMLKGFNGFEEWEEVKEPASFIEVLEAVKKDTFKYISFENKTYNIIYRKRFLTLILADLIEKFNSNVIAEILLEGEFYIED